MCEQNHIKKLSRYFIITPMFTVFLLFLSYSMRSMTRLYILPNDRPGEAESLPPRMDNVSSQSSLTFPGFFEVFPEMKFKWPKWLKDKNGRRKPCKTDNECPFPTTCCSHPILYGEDKFCCSGWGRRLMVPNYANNYIKDW